MGGIDQTSRGSNLRHSLQPPKTPQEPIPFRHTKSQNYEKRSRKRPGELPPSIPEEGDFMEMVNEKAPAKGEAAGSKTRRSGGVDNAGFEMGETRTPVPESSRSSVRESSVRSLTVMREQYCCCARYSRCEKMLLAAVGVLALIIILLVIAVGVLAGETKGVDTEFQWSLR